MGEPGPASGPVSGSSVTDDGFRLRDVAVVAFGPSLVNSIGHGAVMPVLALHARDLGASVSAAALVVAALGIGMLLASLPAGAVVARIGERRTLLIGGVVDAVAMSTAAVTTSVTLLVVAVVISGMTWTAFLIARQSFIIDAVPLGMRARALSTLGGMFRIGVFVGPLLGAGLLGVFELPAVFWLAAVTSLCAGGIAWTMPDFGAETRGTQRPLSIRQVIVDHRATLLTLGSAVVVIGMSRSIRTGLLPLWADHIGLSASTTSLIFAGAAIVDIALFYPGGWLMDHAGRAVTAVPVVAAAAIGCLLLPLTSGPVGVAAVMALIALGNGLGAGIVMTIGADTAPTAGRAQYLGAWRLCGDVGNSGGPLLVSAFAAAAPLGAAAIAIGALTLAGTGWVGYWVRRLDRARAGAAAAEDDLRPTG